MDEIKTREWKNTEIQELVKTTQIIAKNKTEATQNSTKNSNKKPKWKFFIVMLLTEITLEYKLIVLKHWTLWRRMKHGITF